MPYEWLKTLKKIVIDLLIWGLPQLAAFLITKYNLDAITIAGVISIGVKWVIDWLKHRKVE